MKVLVLGSEGFIGSHVSKILETDTSISLTRADIHPCHGDKAYVQIPTAPSNFDKIFKEGFDACINCTGAAHVGKSISNPIEDFHLNTLNVMEILNSIKKESSKCLFLNISSAAVYGQPKNLPINESSELSPQSPYGYHKLMSETIMSEYFEIFGLNSVSLRVFSCYGPGLRKQLFWDTYQKSKSGNLKFWGTGKESRDFVYVEDLAELISRLIKIDIKGHLILNAGSGVEVTIEKAVGILLKELGIENAYIFGGESDPGQPRNWVADNTALLGVVPMNFTPLEIGLAEYTKWLRKIDV